MRAAAKLLLEQTKQDLSEVADNVRTSFKNYAKIRQAESKKSTSLPHAKFSDYLPYGDFDSATSIFDNKTTYSFMLRISPFSGIDRKAINTLTQVISYEIPQDSYVQVINFASPDIKHIIETWESACKGGGIYSYLSSKRRDFYLNGCNSGLWGKSSDWTLRNFELYISISFTKHQSKESNKDLIESMLEIRKKVIRALNNASCYAEIVKRAGFDQLFAQILIPKEQTSNSQYILYPNYFELRSPSKNQKYIMFEVDQWPSNWSIYNSINYTGSFETGRGLGFPFYISYGFKIEDHRESERRATKMRMLKTNQTTSRLVSFFPAMLEEIDDWQFVTGEISRGSRLAKAVMHVVAIIPDSMDTRHGESAVRDHFYQLGFKVNQIRYDCINNFISSLPMSMAQYWDVFTRQKLLSTFLTSSCINLLPIFADNQNYNSPLMMFAGRRGQLFFFDNFEPTENGNFNMIVVGKSGSGKSVFLQEYMTSILRRGGQVVVVDDGRSFQSSCQILGGDFVDFGRANLCINPFSLYQVPGEVDEKFRMDFEEPLIELIVSIMCVMVSVDKNDGKRVINGVYLEILKSAVEIVLDNKGSSGGFSDVRNVLLTDQTLRAGDKEPKADDLALLLKRYAEGRYSRYYNGTATLSLNNLLTIFELSSLHSNTLKTSVLLMVVFLVYTKMQARERRTSLVLDEAWNLLKHEAVKDFIEGIARRARKYNGNLVVATQSISDFGKKNGSVAELVLSQSDWRVLMSADSGDDVILKETLGMTPPELEIAKDLRGDKGRYSEFIIRNVSKSWQIGRLILDPFTAKLYSSKAEDVVAIKKLQKLGMTLEQSIEQLIKQEEKPCIQEPS